LALAAFILPDFLHALNRSRQKRTMADIRTVASAWEARATEVNTYDVVPRQKPGMTVVSRKDLERVLVPTYVKTLPVRDRWDHPLQFVTNGQDYFVRSSGRDGRLDHYVGRAESPDNDIVYSDGAFLEYPEGL
jgi:general secretion pathway protein G